MGEYKKVTIFLNDEIYNEILRIVEYRNKRVIVDNEDKKATTIEEFVTGSVIQVLKWLKAEEVSAGFDDLGKPYRLRNHFKEILKSKGWNQKMLAEKTNIDPSNISIILSNRSQPSIDYFLRIWIALECPQINKCLSRTDD
jgi:DNA-binding Xre family transcriptional regulator